MASAVLLMGCREDAGWGSITVDSAGGVLTVNNPDRGLTGDTLAWTFDQYLLVAGDQLYDRRPATYALDAGIMANGNVVVLDAGNRRVLRFGPDGEYLGAFGGPGQEPGQFATPVFLEVAGDRVYVMDTGLNRVTTFDSAGVFVSRFEVDLRGLAATTPLFAVGGVDELYLAAEPVPFLEAVRDTGAAVIYRMSQSGAIVDSVATFLPARWNQLQAPDGKASYVKVRLAPRPRLSAAAGMVAVSTGAGYSIDIRRPDGTIIRRVTRRYQNVPVTEAIRDSVLTRLAKGPNALAREILDLVSFAAVVPAIDDLLVDDLQQVWVDPYTPEPRRRDIFDAEGRYLGALYLPQPVQLEDVRGDRACGVMSEVTGQAAVVCYRLSTRRR